MLLLSPSNQNVATANQKDREAPLTVVDKHLKDNTEVRALAKQYNVCHVTLYRFVLKLKAANTNAKVVYRCINFSLFLKTFFTGLYNSVLQGIFRINFDWTAKVRKRIKIKYQKKFPEKWNRNHVAGKEWWTGFLKWHTILSLRSPQSHSSSINKHNVNKIFDNQSEVMDRFEARDIRNMDKIEVMAVQRPNKIAAQTSRSRHLCRMWEVSNYCCCY